MAGAFAQAGKSLSGDKVPWMLGLFGPEVVQFFEMSGPLVTFYTSKAKKPDSEHKVRVALVAYPKAKHVDIPVRVIESHPCVKGHLCTGAVDMTGEHLRQLEDLFYNYTNRPDLGEAARRSPRLPIGLKTVSRELPGYNCVTVDISKHGVGLSCHGTVEPGTRVQMTFDTDLSAMPNMTLSGRVVSCREDGKSKSKNKTYLVGVDFAGLPPAQLETLDYYNRTLAGRLKGDIMTRQISDGEMTAGGSLPVNLGAPPPPPPV